VTRRKVLPEWSVRLLVAALLLAPVLVAVDGFARLRRRRQPIGRGIVWVLASALPLIAALTFAIVLAKTGLLVAAPRAPVPKGAIPFDGTAKVALLSVALVVVLCWVLLRPFIGRRSGADRSRQAPGTAGAMLLILAALAVMMWLSNPYEAALLVPALHAWPLLLAP